MLHLGRRAKGAWRPTNPLGTRPVSPAPVPIIFSLAQPHESGAFILADAFLAITLAAPHTTTLTGSDLQVRKQIHVAQNATTPGEPTASKTPLWEVTL